MSTRGFICRGFLNVFLDFKPSRLCLLWRYSAASFTISSSGSGEVADRENLNIIVNSLDGGRSLWLSDHISVCIKIDCDLTHCQMTGGLYGVSTDCLKIKEPTEHIS